MQFILISSFLISLIKLGKGISISSFSLSKDASSQSLYCPSEQIESFLDIIFIGEPLLIS